MFIGKKKVKETRETEEKTPGNSPILEVAYEDGTVERFSKIMYDQIISEESCDESVLRDKRIHPVVGTVLAILREYGVKVGETPYLSALLNQSLNSNVEEATKELWSNFMPLPLSLDDVDLVTIDRVLKSKKKTLNDVIGKKE